MESQELQVRSPEAGVQRPLPPVTNDTALDKSLNLFGPLVSTLEK